MPRTRIMLFILLITLIAATVAAERPVPKVHGEFQGDKMYTLLPPDGIPAIMAPKYVTGAAAAGQMSADEPVMGLASADDAVCWSTWQLDHHEIVNDVFNGTAIAATW
jgi:hypothetical protein